MTQPELSCPKCGTSNPSKAGYCNLCHAPLAASANIFEPGAQAQALSGGNTGVSGDPSVKPALRHRSMLLFPDAERQNVRMSIILFAALFGIFVSLGAITGEALGNIGNGLALAAVLFAILAGTAYYSGSKIILSFHSAEKADHTKHQQLMNAVEEMSIASGLPIPAVYVMPSTGLNAFAAGRHPREAVVAVTQGLLDKLNREELQGVIAHEMAHIKSRDTLYNVCAAVLVGAITMMSEIFLRGGVFRGKRVRSSGSRSGGGGRANIVLIIFGIVLALLAPLAAKILQMSISRQREYHADAAAVEFTRNPLGLASALSRITEGGAHVPGESRGTQHMFIINPLSSLGGDTSDLMSTHPSTEHRIRRLRAMAGLMEG
ncbi:MAG: M48 family metalloprotease [Syntrophorhabdaceae bacterium]|nr:M48 family metalloprotease [Syntrophorhabdaceae bacterium]